MGFINPEDFKCCDIEYSFELCDEGILKSTIEEHQHMKSKYDFLIVSEHSFFAIFWEVVELIMCIISSYVYSWMAVFHTKSGELIIFQFISEITLFVCMIIKMLKDYIPDG